MLHVRLSLSFCQSLNVCQLLHCCMQDAVALVKDIREADRAAHRLVEEAFQRGSNDNISCVVMKFRL